MTTSSVASLRAAPTMAVYGLACVFLYLVPALVFLLPTSLVSAELASGWNGGVYNWVTEGISQADGLPRRLVPVRDDDLLLPEPARLRGEHAGVRDQPGPGHQRRLDRVRHHGRLLVRRVGLRRAAPSGVAGLASGGLIIGTLIPGVLLVILGMVFLGQGNESAAPMNADHLLPAWAGLASLVLIVNNFLSYSGMEMNAVHVVVAARTRARSSPGRCSWRWGWCCSSSSCRRWRSAGSSRPRSCP